MAKTIHRAKSIFLNAIELSDDEQRNAFVVAECANDEVLRQDVDRLLQDYGNLGSFMDSEAADQPTTDQPVTERPGDAIGPYKLLQQIGEGGMGVVYMAEQTEPIERRVALKIIKPGMDTRHVIARFEAERQALAMMDHPNIAKVLDAGVTRTGRPYFVMELVKGTPITRYCDEHQLTPRERLKLFVPVCQAIQHAHHKGIIHRDIKPSNVLVAHYDDQPVPKVIDFGVAKAINHRLTEKTMFTEFGQVLGTIEYMSPEQARLNQWDVDTRTDVYSLGVLLYELLSGETPFDRQRLRSAAFDELLRIIREEDPPRPSARASTSQSLATIADNRKTEPAKLGAVIRGELDWIVMKSLDKDRTRRYETANGLAADIERHLNDEPVVAGPPLARYRLAKFVKRNRLQVVAAGAVAAALVLALVGTSMGMAWAFQERSRADSEAARATLAAQAEATARKQAQENEQDAVSQKEIAERELARATEIKQLITQMLQSVAPANAQGVDTTLLRRMLDDASTRLRSGEIDDEYVAGDLHEILGGVYVRLDLLNEAEEHHLAAVEIRTRSLGPEHSLTLNSTASLVQVYLKQRRWDDAGPICEKTLEARRRILGPAHIDTLKAMLFLAEVHYGRVRWEEAEPLYVEVLETATRELGAEHDFTLIAMASLANRYGEQGRVEAAEPLLMNAAEVMMRKFGPNHPHTLYTTVGMASAHGLQGRWNEAASLLETALATSERVEGPEHESTRWAMKQLAWVYQNLGRHQEAELLYEKRIEICTRVLGTENAETADSMVGLANVYVHYGRYEQAARLAEKALAIHNRTLPGHPHTFENAALVAHINHNLGKYEEAEQQFRQLVEDVTLEFGPGHGFTQMMESYLSDFYTSRAHERLQEEQWDQSAQDWITLLERSDDNNMWIAPRKTACLELAGRPEVFERVAKLQPDETTLWIGRGQHHALRSRWEQAASDYARGFQSRSLHDESLVEYAGTLLLVGDEQGYQRLCQELGDHGVDLQNASECFSAARTCALGRSQDISLQLVVDWATIRLQDSSAPWVFHVVGLAQYRAGEYVEAIDHLEKSNAGDWGDQEALNWIVLAMCHHQLGQADKARECYDTATTLVESSTPEADQPAQFPVPDWIEWHVLQRQAAEMLSLNSDGTNPSKSPDSS